MSRIPRFASIVSIVAGVILIIAGMVTWAVVQRELEDEHITVSADADAFAGDPVDGPLTAYSEAMTIKEHALDATGGQTYAQLDRDDPTRETAMTASFLRASLFTSVVAFGVAALAMGLGVLFIIVGVALLALDRNIARAVAPATEPTEPANTPATRHRPHPRRRPDRTSRPRHSGTGAAAPHRTDPWHDPRGVGRPRTALGNSQERARRRSRPTSSSIVGRHASNASVAPRAPALD